MKKKTKIRNGLLGNAKLHWKNENYPKYICATKKQKNLNWLQEQ